MSVGRPKTNKLSRAEQLKINQRKAQKHKKDSGNVRLEIWLPEKLRDKLTEEAKANNMARNEYVLSLIN